MDQFSRLADAQAAPWLVAWLTLAMVNAGLAQGKNRSGVLWLVLSLVLGPVGTLVVVLLPKVRQKMF